MRIGIDVRSTLKKRTGIGYYTLDLIGSIAKIDSKNSYFLYSYIRPFDIKRRLPSLPAANFRHRVDRLRYRPGSTMRDMDIFHTSSYDVRIPGRAKLVTTVHDIVPLIFPQGYSDDHLMGLEKVLERVLDESAVVIADSLNTRKDLEARFPGSGARIEVVYPGRDDSFSPVDKEKAAAVIRKKYSINGEFILYVGGMDPRKNVPRLIEAFRILKKDGNIPHRLVVLGRKGAGTDQAMELARVSGVDKDMIFPGYVDRNDINLFYSACGAFVYPSLYEGFGLPILEAFSSGAPVVTSSTSSCAEIASDAALTVDPEDVEAIARALQKIISDKDLANDLKARGIARARDFSWHDSAARMLELFRTVRRP
jgi:glycosyltransferase involved in cell wall biosynthesis